LWRKALPYNLDLEQRIDRFAAQFGAIAKKKMFGGVGYLLNGNMVFGIYKQSLVIRTSLESAEELLKEKSVSQFAITGRPMKGWLLVSPDRLASYRHLSDLLNLAMSYVRGLPPK
jgi:TfoX/Sxy family transcriptional regulator of competence genes